MKNSANAKQIRNKNINSYIDGQKNSLEADFLLLDKNSQNTILENFKVSDINELLSHINIPRLWSLELSILYHLSAHELARRVWIIREKFKSQCGEEMYRHYHDNLPPAIQESSLMSDTPLDGNPLQLLRDDTVSIARQLQRLAYIRIRRAESINERKRFVIQSTLLIMLITLSIFCLLNLDSQLLINSQEGKDGAKFLLFIISSGITGTAISMLQRIEKAANVPPVITDSIHDTMQITLSMSNWYITSLLVSGAVFALLVNFITVAHLVNVLDILPDVANPKMPPDTPLLQQLFYPPSNRVDMAKLMLACFLSGFAERLIPDILDNLVKKADIRKAEQKEKVSGS
jgi:hypothetical protein